MQGCASYCAELCDRAPECGSFDAARCRTGCAEDQPAICNPASVAARSCDELKPELRLYDDIARASEDGSDFASGGFGPRFGLCATAHDCEEPLGCSLETNTCGPCRTNEDCAQAYGSHICAEDQTCQQVGCLADDDCSSGICSAGSHECGDCRSDAECSGIFGVCNVNVAKCVECVSDAQCTDGSFGPHCNLTENSCAECLSNSDCTDPYHSRCDPELLAGNCSSCEADADCAHLDLPFCGTSGCVECTRDAHCTDPQKPACDSLFGRCAAE